MMWVLTFIRDNDVGHMLGSGKKSHFVLWASNSCTVRSNEFSIKANFLIVQYFTGRML